MSDKDAFDKLLADRSAEVDNLPQATLEEMLWMFLRGETRQAKNEDSALDERAANDLSQYLHIGGQPGYMRLPEGGDLREQDKIDLYENFASGQETFPRDLRSFIKTSILPNLNPDNTPREFGSFQSRYAEKQGEPLRADMAMSMARDKVRLGKLSRPPPVDDSDAARRRRFYGE